MYELRILDRSYSLRRFENVRKNYSLLTAQFKDLMRKEGTKIIQKQLGTYIKELKNDFAKGLIKPKTEDEVAAERTAPVAKPSSGPALPPPAPSVAKKEPQTEAGVKIKCMTVSLQDTFKCDAPQLYDFFTQRHVREDLLSTET